MPIKNGVWAPIPSEKRKLIIDDSKITCQAYDYARRKLCSIQLTKYTFNNCYECGILTCSFHAVKHYQGYTVCDICHEQLMSSYQPLRGNPTKSDKKNKLTSFFTRQRYTINRTLLLNYLLGKSDDYSILYNEFRSLHLSLEKQHFPNKSQIKKENYVELRGNFVIDFKQKIEQLRLFDFQSPNDLGSIYRNLYTWHWDPADGDEWEYVAELQSARTYAKSNFT